MEAMTEAFHSWDVIKVLKKIDIPDEIAFINIRWSPLSTNVLKICRFPINKRFDYRGITSNTRFRN